MDLKVKRINWMGNIYQKFEAVCQEVDDIVSQDAVKYLENRAQNVGDSVKNFYSGVVHELLPFPTLVSSTKHEAHSVSMKNNVGSSVKSVGGVKENNEKEDDENYVNNFMESLQDSNVIDLANDQQAGAPINHELVNQISNETCSDSLEVEDSHITQEEVGDDSRETFVVKKENLHASIEETAIKSAPEQMNLISVKEKEPLEFSIHSESYSGSSDSACGVSVRTSDNKEVNVEQNLCLIVEENNSNSSTAQVLDFMSLGEKESINASLFSESSDVDEEDTGILAEVSPAVSSESCERPITKTEATPAGILAEVSPAVSSLSCFKSSLISDSPCSKSLGSYSFEIESCKSNSGHLAWCISDGSMVHVCCESPKVAGQVMESHDGLVSSSHCQSMESNDESLVRSIEFSLEDIQLNDDVKLEESCVFVDDSELYAVSCRAQKLRSYKKRIQDAFTSKKRLAKEYEQLAIWYGDADMEPSQGLSRTLWPFSSRTYMDSKNLQVQHASETEWELL